MNTKQIDFNNLTLETALRVANSYQVLGRDGKHAVKVSRNPTLYENSETGRTSYIVNIGACTETQYAKLANFFKKEGKTAKHEEFQAALNEASLSSSIFVNGDVQPWVPAKGEIVQVILGDVATRDGGTALRIVSITPLANGISKKANIVMEEVKESVE